MSKYSHQDVTRGKRETEQSVLLDWGQNELGKSTNERRKVLEFGPSSGYMTHVLKEDCCCDVYIIEADKEDFAKAMSFAVDGIQSDIMNFEWLTKWRDIRFDVIIFADVLEHLYDPSAVLSATKQLLKNDGVVLLSLPNIGHDDVLRNLFMNRFFYTRTGLLDNTHIRFFAYFNLEEFAEKNGFSIMEEKFIRFDRGATEQYDATWQEYNPIDYILDQRQGGDIYQFTLKLVTIEYAAAHNIQYVRTVGVSQILSKYYYDLGEGLAEHNSQEIASTVDASGKTTQLFAVPEGCKRLRWDPAEYPCIIRNLEITVVDGATLSADPVNGLAYDENSIFFNHDDPQFLITLPEMAAAAGLMISLSAYVRILPPHSSDNELAKVYSKLAQMNDENKQLQDQNQHLAAENAILSSRWKNIAKRLVLPKLATPAPLILDKDGAGDDSAASMQELDAKDKLIKKMWVPAKDLGLFVPYKKHDFSGDAGDVKLIAYYLPQYHAIPENDIWWEKGFTEWTNVTKTLPWFEGHYQPRLPYDVGLYDLSNISVTRRQVELAKNYGISGFCVYYYWFNGKRLLEKPLNHFLDPSIDFPFCICWANENWTRRWDGNEMDVLIEQKHSDEDDLNCIADMALYLRDKRYIRIDGKPLVIIYRGSLLPNIEKTISIWKRYCMENGIGDIIVAGCLTRATKDPISLGFDMGVEFPPHGMNEHAPGQNRQHAIFPNLTYRYNDMGKFIDTIETSVEGKKDILKSVFTNWDNTPRRRDFPNMWHLSPEQYGIWLKKVINVTREVQEPEKRLVFINAWNEWAEGAHLEPDQRYGYAYLEETAKALDDGKTNNANKMATKYPLERTAEQQHAIIPAVFLHIQKTAGSSLTEMAFAHYGQEHCLHHGDYIGKSAESLLDVPFISGHFGYIWAEKLIRSRKSFTFLRNPQERVLSFYFFCLTYQYPDEFPTYALARQHSLLEFLQLGFENQIIRSHIWNNQVWQLARGYGSYGNPHKYSMDDFTPEFLLEEAIRHAHDFDFIGFAENFGPDKNKIVDMLQWRLPRSHWELHVNATPNKKSVKDLSTKEREVLHELTSFDDKLYQYVKSELRPDLL